MKNRKNYLGLAHHIECGILHSGIPACCVAYYVVVLGGPLPNTKGHMTKRNERIFKADYPKRGKWIAMPETNYVPCPRCARAGHVVQARRCLCPPPRPRAFCKPERVTS